MRIDPVIFRQYDIRGTVGADLTPDVARAVGAAAGSEARERLGRPATVAVGRDNRPSGAELLAALTGGLVATGTKVLDVGPVPTPALYFAIHHLQADGGVQVTGSHNPPEMNGFKLVLGGLPFAGDDIQTLRERIERDRFATGKGTRAAHDVLEAYRREIVTRIGALARPLHVVVDCGNGVPGLTYPDALEALGARVDRLYCESDGRFPHHHPDPTVLANLRDLQARVAAAHADAGIAFDGDGDRIGAVDEGGTVLFGDQILALLGIDLVQRLGKGREVIFDVKCSDALVEALESAGAKPTMWMTGHSFIKKKMKESGAVLAGEMSGHMFFGLPDYLGFDDALYAAARLLKILAGQPRPLSALRAALPQYVSTPEIRVECAEERKPAIVAAAARYFGQRYPTVTIDGVRWRTGEGWGLIRASNTQPLLVLRFEARTEPSLAAIRREADQVLRAEGVGGLGS
ncbi:MAG TPA: phosphomannomutase/phosphoglucomutase [Gemmatimonadales bacterium]|nr:phosphomannomutase/phosphoglucomutase [Gemmatimonadales bacterium]